MTNSFIQFLKQKITIAILITVVVFNIFNPLADDVFTPIIGYVIDPDGKLDGAKIKLNDNNEIRYGIVLKQLIVAIMVLALIYYFDRFFL